MLLTTNDTRRLMDVPLDRIEPHGVEVRHDLKSSIAAMGQRVPAKLRERRPKRATDPTWFEIVDGKHRVAAIEAIGGDDPTVLAVVEPIGKGTADKHDRAMETLATNNVRDRNLGAEAEAVDTLLSSNKFTVEEISKRSGVNLRTVKELAAMKNGLVPEAFEMVKSGTVARSAAKTMLRLTPERQTELIAGADDDKPVRVADATDAVRNQRGDMLDELDKVRPKPAQAHTQLGHAVQMVAGMYTDKDRDTLINAAAILRGEKS